MVLSNEPAKLRDFVRNDGSVGLAVAAVMTGSMMAFTYNFISFKFLALTSSVTHAICGNVKLIVVVVLPAIFIDHISEARSWLGFGVFLAAAGGYSYLGHVEATKARAAAGTAPATEYKAAPSEATPLNAGQQGVS